MRLKSLNLHGFKSFADLTEFEFHPGVTAIVGPNGCGKSNVVDAVRWVLGETSAKALRGGEMADVIFNGTDRRKPVGMAEVTLTFADCEEALKVDYNEVSLTRRVFRDGKSEYRVNDRLCRLKDIQNLLMDTGIGRSAYSIMEQGKIDMLLSSKPEDRRTVFEEAAGITKFKMQKREALRKLDYTESNLLRVSDIIAELQRQRDSLHRQANKARRYRELLDDLTTLDTHLAHRQYRELSAEGEELKTSITALQKQEEGCRVEIEQRSHDLGVKREKLETMEAQFHELSQQQMTLRSRIQNSNNRLGFNKEREEELHRFVEQNEVAIEETGKKLEEQQSALANAEEHLSSLTSKLENQRSELSAAEAADSQVRGARGQLQRRLQETQGKLNQFVSTIANLEASHASKLEQREGDAHRLAMLEEEVTHLRNHHAQYEQEIGDLTKSIEEEAQELENCQSQRKHFQERLEELQHAQKEKRQQVRELEQAMGSTKSRLDVLNQWVLQGEGFEKGTQSVLKGLDEPETYKNSVRGVLGSMIRVKDDAYMASVEGALKDHLQTVLVANGTVAESMIERLSKKMLGYASVLPEDSTAHAAAKTAKVSDKEAIAIMSVIECDDKIEKRLTALLEHVYVVPTLTRARELQQKHPNCAFVTEDGEVVSPEGILSGGRTGKAKESVLQKQSEIRKLKKQLTEQEKAHETASAQGADVEKQLIDLQTEREALQEKQQQHQLNRSRMEDQRRLATMELERAASRLAKSDREKEELAKRQESGETELKRIQEERDAKLQEKEALHQGLNEVESELSTLAEQEAQSTANLNALRTGLALEEQTEQALRQQRNPMTGRLEELSELRRRHEQEIVSHKSRLGEIEQENAELDGIVKTSQEEVTSVEQRLQESFESRKSIQQEVREFEEVLARKNQERSAVQEQRGREEVRTTQLDLRLENITNAITERYQVEIIHFRPDSHQLLLALESQKARNRRARSGKIEESEPQASTEATAEGALPGEEAEPDWTFIEASVSDMRRKLDSMGPVNLDAIQEFEETEERLQFLNEQHADLTNSKEELLRVLAKINTESRKQFAETFIRVRDNFKSMFRKLFGDQGKADLILLDEEDPLESGIEIIAKPPGKKLQTISLLSGGERSMTAVALLFAIYMVKPSPFCILDELDAPLDEANIARFVNMLDRFIDQSQFVIITHSKRTMSRADVMYGVTMEEFGVSKPVGMKLTDDEDKKTKD